MSAKTLFSQTETPVNTLEAHSLKSLVSYCSYQSCLSEDKVREMFSRQFGVEDVEKLPRKSYEEAIRFLIDTFPETVH